MPSALKLSRVQKKGQVTIPLALRQKHGLAEGNLVAFAETDQGILILPQQVVPILQYTIDQSTPTLPPMHEAD